MLGKWTDVLQSEQLLGNKGIGYTCPDIRLHKYISYDLKES